MIANLTLNTEKVKIDLGDYRFIRFVESPISHTDPNDNKVRVYFLANHKDAKDNLVELVYFEVSALEINLWESNKVQFFTCNSKINLRKDS